MLLTTSNTGLVLGQDEAIDLADTGGHPSAEYGYPYPTVENIRTLYISIGRDYKGGCEAVACIQLLAAMALKNLYNINEYSKISTEYNDGAEAVIEMLLLKLVHILSKRGNYRKKLFPSWILRKLPY